MIARVEVEMVLERQMDYIGPDPAGGGYAWFDESKIAVIRTPVSRPFPLPMGNESREDMTHRRLPFHLICPIGP